MGYKVADFPEMVEHMQETWLGFIDNETHVETVIYRYKKLGFQAICDLPGNTYYKQLYDNTPNCKAELSKMNFILNYGYNFYGISYTI